MDPTDATEPLGQEMGFVCLDRARLEVLDGPDRGRQVKLEAGTLVIGSGAGSGLKLEDRSVSRRHAEIRMEESRCVLVDLDSTNGTFLNGSRIREAYLNAGDLVKIGRVELRFDRHLEEVKVVASAETSFGALFGQSLTMRKLFGILERVSVTAATVLIQGESGSGKELVARAIHEKSPRASRPFATVDCSAISEDLIDSELFGHVPGAFTGAASARKGLFEHASGGTVFIDEIGELPLDVQPKLLRVLEAREVRPVGSNEPKSVDVRVVAATHRDLQEMVKQGKFRQDLYFRLAVVRVRLPPLRERLDDIPGLIERLTRGEDEPVRVEPEALRKLERHPWPGNVRELRNVLERARALGSGGRIAADDVTFDEEPGEAMSEAPPAGAAIPAAASLDDVERQVIEKALARAGGNLTRAAQELGVHRNTLRNKLKRHGLSKE